MCASADASSPNCVTGFDAIFQFKGQASDIPTCGLYLVLQNLRSGHVRLGKIFMLNEPFRASFVGNGPIASVETALDDFVEETDIFRRSASLRKGRSAPASNIPQYLRSMVQRCAV
jgi:hypothetical protein